MSVPAPVPVPVVVVAVAPAAVSPVAPPASGRLLVGAALTACAMVVAMLALFASRGVGQDPLQVFHPPADYAAILRRDPAGLRAVLGFDNAFIAFYTTVFVALAGVLVDRGAPRRLTRLAIALLLATATLDLLENVHFLTMVSAVEQGLGVGEAEIRYQVIESMLKFHLSYIGLFLLSFVLPTDTRAGRAVVWASRYVQLPVGILIYVTPPAVSFVLVLVRSGYFVVSLVGLALAFGRGATGAGRQPGVSFVDRAAPAAG